MLLKAFQLCDKDTTLTSPLNSTQPLVNFSDIETNSNNRNKYKCLEQNIHISSVGNIYGDVWVSSNTKYSSLKRHLLTKRALYSSIKITTILNNIDASPLTKIGFFVHHLVRHDTIESTTYLKSLLPEDTPLFQQELVTIWAGPQHQRKVTGVMKIYTSTQDAREATKIFEKPFSLSKDTNKPTFIRKDY
jgi:hypothetical protein